jgi:predicted permease
LHAILLSLMPPGTGEAALLDLERELVRRQERRGAKRRDVVWFASVAVALALRLRLARAGRGGHGALAGVGTDLRIVLLGLVRDPVTSLAAVVVFALGVGAPTAMFTFSRAIGAELPVPEPHRLLAIGYTDDGRAAGGAAPLTADELRGLRGRAASVGEVGGYVQGAWDLRGGAGDPQRVTGAWITPDLLSVLRQEPIRGRAFAADDARPGAAPVALVGERLWRARFASDPHILGSTIRLDGVEHAVVGILPEHLMFPDGAEVWQPLGDDLAASGPDDTVRRFQVLARLAEGSDLESSAAALLAVGRGLFAEGGEGEGARFVARVYRDTMVLPSVSVVLVAMVALTSCLLLVAAANVANLLLSRAVARKRELAVRAALGAGRRRLLGHHLLESGALAALGGLLGLAIAAAATEAFRYALEHELLWWMVLRLDRGVFVFALALMGIAALLAGLIPALQVAGRDVHAILRSDARTGTSSGFARMSGGLVVAQVTFSVVLLVAAGLMVKGALVQIPLRTDFETERVLAALYALRSGEGTAAAARSDFHRELLGALERERGVSAAVFTDRLPGATSPLGRFEVDGEARPARLVQASPGLFQMIDRPIVRGRDLTWQDGDPDTRAVVVNEAFVRAYLPAGDPIGRTVRILAPDGGGATLATIVGVAPTIESRVGQFDREEAVYAPPARDLAGGWILLRAAPGLDPLDLVPRMHAAMRRLDADRPLQSVDTLEGHVRRDRLAEWALAALFGTFGLAGLLVATTGLYAVMAVTVSRRRREVGVRVALGARPLRVALMMVRSGGAQLVVGLALGLVIASRLAPLLGGALMGIDPRDPGVHAAVVAVILATGLAAAAVPAARAARVSPAEALQSE